MWHFSETREIHEENVMELRSSLIMDIGKAQKRRKRNLSHVSKEILVRKDFFLGAVADNFHFVSVHNKMAPDTRENVDSVIELPKFIIAAKTKQLLECLQGIYCMPFD